MNCPFFGPAAKRHLPSLPLVIVLAALVLTVDTHFVNTPFSFRHAADFFELVALVTLPLVVVTFVLEVVCVTAWDHDGELITRMAAAVVQMNFLMASLLRRQLALGRNA